MTFPRPAPSVPFASSPLQTAPDQKRATQHGVGPLSRRAFSFNTLGWVFLMGAGRRPTNSRAVKRSQPRAAQVGHSSANSLHPPHSFQSSRLSPSFLRAGAGSGDCSGGNLPRYSGRRLSFNSKD